MNKNEFVELPAPFNLHNQDQLVKRKKAALPPYARSFLSLLLSLLSLQSDLFYWL